jgi:hypothetical protein
MGEINASELNQSLEAQIFHLLIRGVDDYDRDLDELCAEAHFDDAMDAMRSR